MDLIRGSPYRPAASGKRCNQRPDRRPRSITCSPVQKLLASRAATTEGSYRRRDQTIRGTTKGLKTSFSVNLSATEDRLDPSFYLFRAHAMPALKTLPEIGDHLIERKGKFSPVSDEEIDAEYSILSVSNDGGISLKNIVKGEDIDQKYKMVYSGDIAYNPMRANVGSFGVVSKEYDGGLISPDYFVMRPVGINPDFIVTLLNTPYYRMYIDVVTTGSIRDRLYPDALKRIHIPNLDAAQQATIYNVSQRVDQDLNLAITYAADCRNQINDRVQDLIVGTGQGSTVTERFKALSAEWEHATAHLSSYSDIVSHPAYQAIIALGSAALPSILDRLGHEPMFWFSALERISGENPAENLSTVSVEEAANAWLAWGEQNGLVN